MKKRTTVGKDLLNQILDERRPYFKTFNTVKGNKLMTDPAMIVAGLTNASNGVYSNSLFKAYGINIAILESVILGLLAIEDGDLKDTNHVQLDPSKSTHEILEDCLNVKAYVTYIKVMRRYVYVWLEEILTHKDVKEILIRLKANY